MREGCIVIVVTSSEDTQLLLYVFVYILDFSLSFPKAAIYYVTRVLSFGTHLSQPCCKGNFEPESPHHLVCYGRSYLGVDKTACFKNVQQDRHGDLHLKRHCLEGAFAGVVAAAARKLCTMRSSRKPIRRFYVLFPVSLMTRLLMCWSF